MNETISILQNHRSIRAYADRPIDEAHLTAVIAAAHRAPSSINGQQISLVVVRDRARREQIAAIAGGQPWIAQAPVFIAVVIDFHKTGLGVEMAGARQVAHESVEGTLAGAVDAGIVLSAMMIAAQSLGLGIVPIGGIRRNPQAMIDLLALPARTFPVVGLTLGHPTDRSSLKPRMGMEAFRHEEAYDASGLPAAIARYDEVLMDYWKRLGREEGDSWSRGVAAFYDKVYFPEVGPVARSQGFLNDC